MKNLETLRLFNAIQIEDKCKKCAFGEGMLEDMIRNGFVLDERIKLNDALLRDIKKVVGISGEKANAAFHKSWATIEDTPQEALWMQAIVHYMTTYGFQAMGIYNESTVYIPNEKLEIPELKDDIPLVVVKAMTAEEILEKIVDLGSGIALMSETLCDMLAIVMDNKYDSGFVDKIKNRELNALLCDYYGIVPQEPVAFLRHLVSKLTDESLIIKNKNLIDKIKLGNGKFLDELLRQAPDNLASIFFRYKPLFLAMKSASRNKTYFNQLRKKANKMHKPLPVDYLNSITSQIKKGELKINTLKKKLKDATIFRKIRLAYALKFRESDCESIVYRVRSGRGWATDFEWDDGLKETTTKVLNVVLTSIAKDIKPKVNGKTIFIPKTMHYTLPATEKQFTGFFPTGSYASVPDNMLVGIHWCNTHKSVDLDLSTMSVEGKVGWDSSYKSRGNDVLFSGDITDAPKPKGASELFYFKSTMCPQLLMVNYYNFSPDDEVSTKILMGYGIPKTFRENHMVDPNNIIASTNINISKKENVLGLIARIDGESRFYFANIAVGNAMSSRCNAKTTHAREYLLNSMVGSIDLKDVLVLAGANVVDEMPVVEVAEGEEAPEVMDLSPEKLDKTTIIDLISKK